MYKLIETNKKERKSVHARMITSRPVDLGQRVIYERGEKKKEKDSYCTIGQYTIVFKVIELAIYFCTCYYNDTNNNIFSNKYNIFFSYDEYR
jgi:hypothetical protein